MAIVTPEWADFIDSVCEGSWMIHPACESDLCSYLVSALDLEGDVIECGCFKGSTSLVLAKVLRESERDKQLHVYDSFEGLPPPTASDRGTTIKESQARASVEDVLETFDGVEEPPIIHAGWFSCTIPAELPERISFAFLDGDFYESIRVCMEGVFPRLARGGMMYVHDYDYPKLPGAKKAVDEFVQVTPNAFFRASRYCSAVVIRGF